MEPFATVDDLNARRATPLTGDDAAVATARLHDATAKVAQELADAGVDYRRRQAKSEVYAQLLTSVTCAMVERTLASVLPGVKSRQQSAGPYSFTDSFANPTGDMYLLASEKKSLGIGHARVGTIRPHIGHRR